MSPVQIGVKAMAIACVLILLANSLVLTENLLSKPSAPMEALRFTAPKSVWDFQIQDFPSADYPHWAAGMGYAAFFAGHAAPDTTLKLRNSAGAVLTESLQGGQFGSAWLPLGDAFEVHDGNLIQYPGVLDGRADLQFRAGLSAVKEDVVLRGGPPAAGSIQLLFAVNFGSALTPLVDGEPVDGDARLAREVVLVDAAGAEQFRLPRSFVTDSRPLNLGGPAADDQALGAHVLWLDYQVHRNAETLYLTVEIPRAYLATSGLLWPLTLDPTVFIPPTVSGPMTFRDCTAYLESNLLINQGGILELDNCTVFVNGSYYVNVAPGGALILNHTTLTTNTSSQYYTFYAGGTVTTNASEINHSASGIEITGSETVSINTTLINNSESEGISMFAPATVSITNSSVTNAATSGILLFDPLDSLSPSIRRTTITNASDGINVTRSTVTTVPVDDWIQGSRGTGIKVDNSSIAFENMTVVRSTQGAFADTSTVRIGNSSIYEQDTGVRCINSGLTLEGVLIVSSSVADISASGCTMAWIDGGYNSWVRSLSNSPVDIEHRITVQVLDQFSNPIPNLQFGIVDQQSSSALYSTNSQGYVSDVLVKEFSLDTSGVATFHSPHRFDMVAGQSVYSVHDYIGGRRNYTLYATGDADNDSIPDATEDKWQNELWIEGEDKAAQQNLLHDDLYASNKLSVGRTADGTHLTNFGWPTLAAGTYMLYVRAAGNGLGATLNISALHSDGSTALAVTTYGLGEAYDWISTPNFTLGSADSIRVNLTSSAGQAPDFLSSAVFVDRFAIIRVKDGSGTSTGFVPGQVTDPVDPDSDFDGLRDGREKSTGRAWYEAELLNPAGVLQVESQAWSGRVAQHAVGNLSVLNSTLEGFQVTPNVKYQLYVRMRSNTTTPSNASVTISDGTSSSNLIISAATNLTWYAGPTLITANNANTLRAQVADIGDPNPVDSTNYLCVDAVAVFDTTGYPSLPGRFSPSSPLYGDTDHDGLPDGPEVDGFFTAEIEQAENYTSAVAISRTNNGISFTQLASQATYSIPIQRAGQYRFVIKPVFTVTEGMPALTDVQDLLKLEVTDFLQVPVLAVRSEFGAFAIGSASSTLGGSTQVGAFYDGRFELLSQTYTVKVSINTTQATNLSVGHHQFNISVDSFLVQKLTLNTTNADTDGDQVPDGYEVNHTMLPLRQDSDYDGLSDYEEITPGADGYLTNPISNDTDADGILDSVEVGLSGWDADPTTKTDPTNPDTDHDGVPDGWIDGWRWFANRSTYGIDPFWVDGLKQPWEGEDLNLNGAVGSGTFSMGANSVSTGGETNPLLWDTDNDTIDDGWELRIWHLSGTTATTLNPLLNDSSADYDPFPGNDGQYDYYANYQEYSAGTNPFETDTDHDGIKDGNEGYVTLRTSITNGSVNTLQYPNATASSWIFYDSNPYDANAGRAYSFAAQRVNQTWSSGFSPNWTKTIARLTDGGLIVYNATTDKIAVWDFDSDAIDADHNGVLDGVAYEFDRNTLISVETAAKPAWNFKGREIVGPVSPLLNDSDGDGVIDGNEGYRAPQGASNDWSADYDGDGLPAAADRDSDGDGIGDGSEDSNRNGVFEPALNETAAFAADTDGDGTNDQADLHPLDQDNDFSTGFLSHSGSGWTIDEFTGQEHCAARAAHSETETSYTNPDTDGDGIPDGVEDANGNCIVDANETSPVDVDTDDDGLWDGPTILHTEGNVSIDPTQYDVSSSQDVGPYTPNGGAARLRVYNDYWNQSSQWAQYTSVSLSKGQYVVHANMSEPGVHTGKNRTFEVSVDGKAWWRAVLALNTTDETFQEYDLGHILVPSSGTHTIRLSVARGIIDVMAITLTPANLSEQRFGTSPLQAYSDNDSLADGQEIGLTAATVTGSSTDWKVTLLTAFHANQNGYWSDPTSMDTDHDGLVDGSKSGSYNGTSGLGEDDHGTNPASSDSDGDLYTDFQEVFWLGSNPLSEDTDGDGLPDFYEPRPLSDLDADGVPAIRDTDADLHDPPNETVDYNSTERWLSGSTWITKNITAVFRTNAVGFDYAEAGTYVAIDPLSAGSPLGSYGYDSTINSLSGYSVLRFQTRIGQDGITTASSTWYDHNVTTVDGHTVWYDSLHGYVAIRVSDTLAYRFTDCSCQAIFSSPYPTLWNPSGINYRYHETLNWSAVLVTDHDGDGLSDSEEDTYHTSKTNPDSDGDGLLDGSEVHGWHTDPMNPDTDGDGLTDGYEVLGPVFSYPDKADSDNDGLWDGNFSWMRGGMGTTQNKSYGERINGTQPLNPDSDGDGTPDGWEVYYHFNPNDPQDAYSDNDWDNLDNIDEYTYHMPEGWNLPSNTTVLTDGVWWNGTDPNAFDTDGDTMPDGWEYDFGLNATWIGDKTLDPDGDTLPNYREYALSITGTWNTSRAWPSSNSLDPNSADTDGDGMTDDYEAVTVVHNPGDEDPDHDGIVNAVDTDSDGDGLSDYTENLGWSVGVIEAAKLTQYALGGLNMTSKDFSWYHVTSNPYVGDTDSDGLGDLQEYQQALDPRHSDTDADGIPDAADYISDVSGKYYTGGMQTIDPPNFHLEGWAWAEQPCGKYGMCANISYVVYASSGLAMLTFTNIGEPNTVDYLNNNVGGQVYPQYFPGWTTGYVWVPLVGAADFKGEFKILVDARDNLGNEGKTLFIGGRIFEKYKRWVEFGGDPEIDAMRRDEVTIESAANWYGKHYGFDLGAINGGAWMDDLVSGRFKFTWKPGSILGGMWDSLSGATGKVGWALQHPGTCDPAGDVYYSDRIQYANSVALPLDPFKPTMDDAINLSSEKGIWNIFCQVWHPELYGAPSEFARWFVNFFDGSVEGGIAYMALQIIPMLLFPAQLAEMFEQLASVGRAIIGMIWTLLTTAGTSLADVVVSFIRIIIGVFSETGSEAADAAAEVAPTLIVNTESVPQAIRVGEDLQADIPGWASAVDDDPSLATTSQKTVIEDAAGSEVASRYALLEKVVPTSFSDVTGDHYFPAYKDGVRLAAKYGINKNLEGFLAAFDKDAAAVKRELANLKTLGADSDDMAKVFRAVNRDASGPMAKFKGDMGEIWGKAKTKNLAGVQKEAWGEIEEDGYVIHGKADFLSTPADEIHEIKMGNYNTFDKEFGSLRKFAREIGHGHEELIKYPDIFEQLNPPRLTTSAKRFVHITKNLGTQLRGMASEFGHANLFEEYGALMKDLGWQLVDDIDINFEGLDHLNALAQAGYP